MIQMNLNKTMKLLRISFVFIVLIIIIFATSLLIQFPSIRSNFFTYLSIVPTVDECQGSLELSSSSINECLIDAKIVTDGCLGRNYQIRENSCSGGILCQDSIEYDSFQATCVWAVPSSNYRYVICVNNKQKDSKSVMCR